MATKGVKQTQEHKDNIGKSKKGIHLNTSRGKLILKDGKKICSKCKGWKLLSEYDKRPERPIGVKPKCKECEKEYRRDNQKQVKYAQYKSGAKKRGIEFTLTKEHFNALWQNPCNYCGDEVLTIGIDRTDSNSGYSADNVVSCCTICNVMKLALPRNVFVQHCYKVVKHYTD